MKASGGKDKEKVLMESQVTTRRGDEGYTSALSGDSFPKSHIIMECVGTVDELRAHLALVRLRVMHGDPKTGEFLLWLLHVCFVLGSTCSDPGNKHPEYHLRHITEKDVARIEAEQARIEAVVRLPHAFVVSASKEIGAIIDITTTVARRLERNMVRLREAVPEFDNPDLFVFVNRLSDCLFMLARSQDYGKYQTVDYSLMD